MLVKTIKLYPNRDDVTLTTYVIAEVGELNVIGKRPAVLICPGGAYLGCSDREAEPVALKFAAMGYHAFVLRYSTYNEGKGWPDIHREMPEKTHCQHPTPMREIGKAMLRIRESSEEWFVDMDRIAICGFSAGAHNAAMFGCYWNQAIMTEELQTTKEEIRPAALILCYGVSDYILLNESAKAEKEKGASMMYDVFKAAHLSFFGTTTPSGKQLVAASPARLVTEHVPPTFIWSTAADQLVPVNQSIVMANALAEKKIPFELHIFEEGAHGLSLATQASTVERSQLDVDSAKWIDLVECWLKKRFALSIPIENA